MNILSLFNIFIYIKFGDKLHKKYFIYKKIFSFYFYDTNCMPRGLLTSLNHENPVRHTIQCNFWKDFACTSRILMLSVNIRMQHQ